MKKSGLNFVEADSAGNTLDLIQTQQFNLILMDLKLPDINGYELTKIIKSQENFNQCPIIAFTASSKKYEKDEVLDIFDGYLLKPINYSDLVKEFTKHIPVTICQIAVPEEITANRGTSNLIHRIEFDEKKQAGFILNSKLNNSELNNLIKLLEKRILPKISKSKEIIIMDDIFEIISELKDFRNDYNVPILNDYIENINTYYLHYDIHNLQGIMHQFPTLIENIRKLLEPNDH